MALPRVLDRVQQLVLLWCAGTLVLLGLVFVYSASSVLAMERFGSAHHFLIRHAIRVLVGLVAWSVARFVPVTWWYRWAPFLFVGGLVLTAATFLPGIGLRCNGASRWLLLGGVSWQPSEWLKPLFVFYLARFLQRRSGVIHRFKHDYLPLMVVFGVTSLLLLKQPDFGAAVLVVTTGLALLFVAEWNLRHLFFVAAALVPFGVLLILTRAYRLARILIFLNPWSDPQGRGFQIIQSLIAIASGGLWGVGIACSKQKFFYLPMQHTDFIFPIIAEEIGFVGSVFVVLLYVLLAAVGFRISCRTDTLFACLSGIGFTTLISLQAMANIMVASGLLPTKGLDLPLISYGGSALVANLFMIGFLSQLAAKTKS